MSIENNIESIADSLKSIDSSLKTISKIIGLGGISSPAQEVTDEPETVTTNVPAPAAKKASKKKTAKKETAKKETAKKVEEVEEVEEVEAEVVEVDLATLRDLGKKVIKNGRGKDMKNWIREHGAENLSTLAEEHRADCYEALKGFANG